jgi:LacI family transcriptional regulator
VSRLLRKGHRRIASVTGPKYVLTAKERQIGYLRALSDFDVPFDDSLVISGENSFATGYRGIDTLLALKDPPTAVFTTNYNITIGLITAARERGLQIPEDIDIFGFDCVDICSMLRPPLPVVHQPEPEIGALAANYLIQRLDGYTGEPRVTKLKCKHNL